jgi:hypothetical protein
LACVQFGYDRKGWGAAAAVVVVVSLAALVGTVVGGLVEGGAVLGGTVLGKKPAGGSVVVSSGRVVRTDASSSSEQDPRTRAVRTRMTGIPRAGHGLLGTVETLPPAHPFWST